MSNKENQILAAKSEYIEPIGCDSTVSYKVIGGKYQTAGTVTLADCGRKIDWSFYEDTPVSKIDKAIELLQEFRTVLIESRKPAPRIKRERKKA